MSTVLERRLQCPDCKETFIGYGRGSNAANRAFREAKRYLKAHQCLPLDQPDPIPKISSSDLNAIIHVLHEAMPDVTIYRHKV